MKTEECLYSHLEEMKKITMVLGHSYHNKKPEMGTLTRQWRWLTTTTLTDGVMAI